VDDWSTFGQLDVSRRVWRPPVADAAGSEWAEFRGAVVQSAYCVHIRNAKNDTVGASGNPGMTQVEFAALDDRPSATQLWNDRLCGRTWLHPADIAVVAWHLPGAIPRPDQLQVFLTAASTPGWLPPAEWQWPDRCGSPLSMKARRAKRALHATRTRG